MFFFPCDGKYYSPNYKIKISLQINLKYQGYCIIKLAGRGVKAMHKYVHS